MSIINRYVGIHFLRVWLMALAGFMVLYTAVDFLEKIGDFMNKSIPFGTIMLYFMASLPKIVVLMAPVATLVGVLITLAVLARNSEIVAFKAGGVSLYRLSAPILAASLLICLAAFIVSDFIAPRTTAIANRISEGQLKEKLGASSSSSLISDVWLKDVRQVQHYGTYDENSGAVTEVMLIFLDENHNLAKRVQAPSGQMFNKQLHLYNAMEKIYQPVTPATPPSFVVNRPEHIIYENWAPPPSGFGRSSRSSDELSVAELWRTIDRLKHEGFRPVRQRVDLHFKLSFALLSMIMAVVGLPLGFWKEKGGSVALGLATGLVLSFIYLIVMEFARSLGYSGLLPPIIVAWLPNMMFLLFGAYLFSYIRQ